MPLFLVFIIFVTFTLSETHCITVTNLDDAGDAGDVM